MDFGTIDLQAQVRIRRCREEDLGLLEWYGAFWAHRALIREAFERQGREEVLMLVADLQGFPIGQLWIDLTRKAEEGVAVLWAFRMLDAFQGLGLGRQLVKAAERAVARAGFPLAEIAVHEENAGARRLYERLGYVRAGEERDTFSYVRPDGATITETSEHWFLRKPVGPRGLSRTASPTG